jgi:catechol 2,3-dioxygenase-like lactoylglutathione lyase family enzyme
MRGKLPVAKPELDVGLVTRNADAARDFYERIMGFDALPAELHGDHGTEWRFRVGNHFIRLNDLVSKPTQDEGGTDKANGIRLLAFILDDLASVLARFDADGKSYRRLSLPEGAPFQVAFASDADGNALELVGLKRPAGDKLTTRMQIGLTVSDIEQSKRFYGEILGLPAEPEMKLPASMGTVGNVRYGYVAGGTTIKFWSMGDALPKRTGAPGSRTGIRQISAVVEDLDGVHEHLRRRGVPIEVGPSAQGGKSRALFASDPDGNWIELATA